MNLRRPPERVYFHDIALGSPDHVRIETVPFRRTAWWKLCVGGWLLSGMSVFSVSGGFCCHPMGESLSPAKYPQSRERTFLTPSGESLMWSVAHWQKSIPANLMFFIICLFPCPSVLFLFSSIRESVWSSTLMFMPTPLCWTALCMATCLRTRSASRDRLSSPDCCAKTRQTSPL